MFHAAACLHNDVYSHSLDNFRMHLAPLVCTYKTLAFKHYIFTTIGLIEKSAYCKNKVALLAKYLVTTNV